MDTQTQDKTPINPNDLLIFQIIDSEDFLWNYDMIKTPLPYFIKAGETRELPYFIAYHGINKLIDKILMRENKIHTSPIFRAELMDKIVLGLKHINYVREQTPNEIALEAMKRKPDADPLQELLKRREIEAERQEALKVAQAKPQAPLLQTTGAPIAPQVQVANPVAPSAPLQTGMNNIDAPEIVADPARQEVYTLLSTKLHLDLTHVPTKQKFDSMSVDALKQEFASQLPELGVQSTPMPPLGIQGNAPLTPDMQPVQVPNSLRTPASVLDTQLGAVV